MTGKRKVIYSHASVLTSGNFFYSLYQDLKSARELTWRLILRDIQTRYRQSLLGIFWAFITPLATVATFIVLNRTSIISAGKIDIPYPLFVLTGSILWESFTASINAPIQNVTANKALLAKINFPREALVLSGLGQSAFDTMIKLLFLILAMMFFKTPITMGMILFPFALLTLMLFGTMIGIIILPFGLLYNDFSNALQHFLRIWFFITPVAFAVPQDGAFAKIIQYNPVTPLIVFSRDLLTKGALTDFPQFFTVAVITAIGLFFGWILYRVSMPILVERMHA
jgi:lipopolysaccharide transport system permease protein